MHIPAIAVKGLYRHTEVQRELAAGLRVNFNESAPGIEYQIAVIQKSDHLRCRGVIKIERAVQLHFVIFNVEHLQPQIAHPYLPVRCNVYIGVNVRFLPRVAVIFKGESVIPGDSLVMGDPQESLFIESQFENVIGGKSVFDGEKPEYLFLPC